MPNVTQTDTPLIKHWKRFHHNAFSYQEIFLWVLGIITLRVLAEWILLPFPIQLDVVQDYARFYLENIYYFLIVFTVGCILTAKLIKISVLEVMHYGLKVYPVIILPPIIDTLLFGRMEGYYYATVENLSWNFLTLSFLRGDASLGISIEILLGLSLMSWYVYAKTKNILKSIFIFIVLDLLLVLLSTPELIFGVDKADYYYDYFLPLYYFLPFSLFLCGLFFLYDRKKFLAVLNNWRFLKGLMFLLAVILGVGAKFKFQGGFHSINFALVSLISLFLWKISIIINDIHDIEIDKLSNSNRPLVQKNISKEEYDLLLFVLIFLSLSFGIVVNLKVFCLTGIGIILSFLYSSPPFRLRNNFSGNILIGGSLVLCFYLGALSSEDFVALKIESQMRMLSLLILIVGSIASLTKDVKDIEADKAAGVHNLFTIYGKKKAKSILTSLMLALAVAAGIMIHSYLIVIVVISAVYLYWRREKEIIVYLALALMTTAVVLNILKSNEQKLRVNSSVNAPNTYRFFRENSVVFENRDDQLVGKIYEINGWTLLEILLLEINGVEVPVSLKNVFSQFNHHNGLYGWWPQQKMTEGKKYFLGEEPLKFFYDVQTTALGNRMAQTTINDDIIRHFISNANLPENFQSVCQELTCKKEFLIRKEADAARTDIDIAATIGFISNIQGGSELQKNVLTENARLVNYIIENKNYYEYVKHYKPKAVADFLILFNDENKMILTNRAREIVRYNLRQGADSLLQEPLTTSLSYSEDWESSFKIKTLNKAIPSLIYEYIRQSKGMTH